MIQFLRIEDRGLGLVAVFDHSHAGFTDAGHGYYDDGTFCLNEKNLRLRITNPEREHHDTSVEHAALAELVRRRTSITEQAG